MGSKFVGVAFISAVVAVAVAGCGTSPSPATSVTCTQNSAASINAPAGSTIAVEVVEDVGLADPAYAIANLPLNDATGTVYPAGGFAAVCSDVANCAGTIVPTLDIKTDVNGVVHYGILTAAPATVGGTQTSTWLQTWGNAGTCSLSIVVTAQ